MKKSTQSPTLEEVIVALSDFAALYGRTWKAHLREHWSSGRAVGVLQSLRDDSTFGLSGLARFQFPIDDLTTDKQARARALIASKERQTTRKHVLSRVKELGASYTEPDGKYYTLCIEAPSGFRWYVGPHEIVCQGYYIGTPGARQLAHIDALERMADGVERCTDEQCEWCQTKIET